MLKEQVFLHSSVLLIHGRAYLELYQSKVENRLELALCPCPHVLEQPHRLAQIAVVRADLKDNFSDVKR